MTTKERSAHASKGLPVNHCSGFRTPNSINSSKTDGTKNEYMSLLVLVICGSNISSNPMNICWSLLGGVECSRLI
jgi:hypothetical protein